MGIMKNAKEKIIEDRSKVDHDDSPNLLTEQSDNWEGDSKLRDSEADDELNRRRRMV